MGIYNYNLTFTLYTFVLHSQQYFEICTGFFMWQKYIGGTVRVE